MRHAPTRFAAWLSIAGCAGAQGAPTEPADIVIVDIRPVASALAAVDAGADEASDEEGSIAILGALGSTSSVIDSLGDLDPIDGLLLGGGAGGLGVGVGAGGLGAPSPFLEVGMPIVTGGFSAESAASALRSRRGELLTCHSLGLARDATLSGAVALRFEVAPSGAVQSLTEGGSTIRDPEVVRCLLRAVTTLRFPAGPAAASITVPILLRPSPRMHP